MRAHKIQMAGYARRHCPYIEVLEAHRNETLTARLIERITAELKVKI